ncbi:MAG TPA: hypothetical protein VMS64_38900 [Candidatus Methylomirabilis sp.]|nr:hypothetical protein [Candidatus Methylomirabilis sp.]
MPKASRIAKSLALLMVSVTVESCSSMDRNLAYMGWRPAAVSFRATDDPCTRYDAFAKYSQDLQEAYHSRASQNRWWIYVAGTTALGTAAATGGLAAAGAAALTITLMSISGGFASGFFAFLDNAALADIYTISANQVAEGLQASRAALQYQSEPTGSPAPDQGTPARQFQVTPDSCATALRILDAKVTTAQTDLERARTDSAVAAILRAKAQQQQVSKLMSDVDAQSLREALRSGVITAITPAAAAGNYELTVSGIDFSKLQQGDFVVQVDAVTVPVLGWVRVAGTGDYKIAFTPPPPGATPADHSVALVAPKADASVPSKAGVTLSY